MRTRLSAQGDLGSHWSTKFSHCVPWTMVGFSVSPGVRRSSSASAPRMEYAMSASPRLSMARRVDSSVTDLKTSRFTDGGLRQYWSKASITSSMPGVNETNRYGPHGRLLEALVPNILDVLAGHDPAGAGGR